MDRIALTFQEMLHLMLSITGFFFFEWDFWRKELILRVYFIKNEWEQWLVMYYILFHGIVIDRTATKSRRSPKMETCVRSRIGVVQYGPCTVLYCTHCTLLEIYPFSLMAGIGTYPQTLFFQKNPTNPNNLNTFYYYMSYLSKKRYSSKYLRYISKIY